MLCKYQHVLKKPVLLIDGKLIHGYHMKTRSLMQHELHAQCEILLSLCTQDRSQTRASASTRVHIETLFSQSLA